MQLQQTQLASLVVLSLFLSSGCSLGSDNATLTGATLVSGEQYQKELTDEERINQVRDRRDDIDSIRKGDYFVLRNNPEEALTYYLPIAEKLPDDVILMKKIGHAYYQKKDWKNAYASYVKTPIGELSESEKNEFLLSLFFDESQNDRIGELLKIPMEQDDRDYYAMMDACSMGASLCNSTIAAYTGSNLEVVSLKDIIVDAEKVSPDIEYKNFVLANRLYEYGAYRASSLIARDILVERPDYNAVEKLLGFALYEIGNYTDSKKYLLKQLERMPQDVETIARLGDIAFEQGDFETANLYFNNAILAGHTDKLDLERKLAYSYSRLGDISGMMKVLAYIIENPGVTIDDIAVAVSLALQNGENLKAYVWADAAIKKYPDSPVISALYLTSMRTVGRADDARIYLDTLSGSLMDAPVILLEKAILLMDDEKDTEALTLFEEVYQIDETSDFGIEAKNYIDFLQAKKILQAQETNSGTNISITDDTDEVPWWR